MVNLTTTILLLCAISNAPGQYDEFYPNCANFTLNQTLPSLQMVGVDDHSYFFTNDFEMSCRLWYDDEGNYRVDHFLFSVYTECYEINPVNGTYNYVSTGILDYTPTWSFTQNSYANEFSLTKFRIFVDDDSTYTIQVYYNNSSILTDEFINGPAIAGNYYLDITLDSSQFFQQIDAYIGVPVGGVSDADYQRGYSDGWYDASNQNSTAVTIFSGILNVGLLPVNFFLAILNFEVFGINIGGFVTGLLTIAIIVIVVRFIFGNK